MRHLWTPWRSAYIQAKTEMGRCVFCEAAEGTADEKALLVYRGALCFVILNRFPYTSGHLMIAPYEHVSRLSQTDVSTTDEMMLLARYAEQILEDAYHPEGLNLGMNLGEAAGAGIEQHIHLHVLPRWKGDANFMSTVGGTRVIPESLEITYGKLQPRFAEIALLKERA
ncbi:MAG: HIT domain-containing protein [Acidobacteriaceae bacterium]|nr:HIT domain-containing protein [Acidobacteriaceae bacterium]MBV9781422.1 HIT domain-containing protein [Acidobacteriaceae bacterium]